MKRLVGGMALVVLTSLGVVACGGGGGSGGAASGSATAHGSAPAAANANVATSATASAAPPSASTTAALAASAAPAATSASAEAPAATASATTVAARPAGTPATAVGANFVPKPYKVGQWAKFATTEGSQVRSENRFEVVGTEGPDFWIELEVDKPAPVAVQVLVDPDSRLRPSADAVKKVRMKMGAGPIQDLSGVQLEAIKQTYGQQLGAAVPDWTKLPREDTTVPAGAFQNCFVFNTEQKLQGMTIQAKVWYHPDVPVVGWARNESVVSGRTIVMLLQAWGDEGATKAF